MTFSEIKTLFLFACCILCVGDLAPGGEVSGSKTLNGRSIAFDSRGYLKIDGQPQFILGFYEYPKEDAKLKELTEAGYNLVRASSPKQLDRLHELGAYGWFCIFAQTKEGDEAKKKQLGDKIDAVKNHPAMLIWELPDECLWNVWHRVFGKESGELAKQIAIAKVPAEKKTQWQVMLRRATDLNNRSLFKKGEAIYDRLWQELGKANPLLNQRLSQCHAKSVVLADDFRRGCEFLRARDPHHPIWQNHAPRNSTASLRRFNQYVDAAGCDIYPVPFGYIGHSDLIDQNLTAVGAFTRRMRAAAEGKSCWMVLQGFGWGDLREYPKEKRSLVRRPTWKETRFMAYDSIVNGANAILYYGTYSIEKDSPLWKDLLRIAKEIRSIEPLLVAESPEQQPIAVATETYGSIDPEDGPKLLLRHRGKEWLLIAVNQRKSSVPFTVKNLPKELEGKCLKRLHSKETVEVKAGTFHDGIVPHGVHVYTGTSD